MSALRNSKHEVFAVAVAGGDNNSDAYRKAYPEHARRWQAVTIHKKASLVRAREEVQGRISELQEVAAATAVMSAQEQQVLVQKIIRDALADGDRKTALAGMDRLMRLTGSEADKRVIVRNGGVTDDYRAPPAVAGLSDEELSALLADR